MTAPPKNVRCIDCMVHNSSNGADHLRDAIEEEEEEQHQVQHRQQHQQQHPRDFLTPLNPMVLSLLNCMRYLIIEMEPRFESNLPQLNCNMSNVEVGRLCEQHIDHCMQCLDTLRYRDALCKHLPHRKNTQKAQNAAAIFPSTLMRTTHQHFHSVI